MTNHLIFALTTLTTPVLTWWMKNSVQCAIRIRTRRRQQILMSLPRLITVFMVLSHSQADIIHNVDFIYRTIHKYHILNRRTVLRYHIHSHHTVQLGHNKAHSCHAEVRSTLKTHKPVVRWLVIDRHHRRVGAPLHRIQEVQCTVDLRHRLHLSFHPFRHK